MITILSVYEMSIGIYKELAFYNSCKYYIHRCTRVENPGEGVPDVFCQNPKGGQGFQEKMPGGGVPLFQVLLHFY